jgi:GAF domain-containing protein
MRDATGSVLAPRPFSPVLWGGLAGIVLIAVLDVAVGSHVALAGALAVVALLVALGGRQGDTLVVAALALAVGLASGSWNGWDSAWFVALIVLAASAVISVLVALLRLAAVVTGRRLALLRALLELADEPAADVPELSDRLLGLLVPRFADDGRIDLETGAAARAEPGAIVLPLTARGLPFGTLQLQLGASGRRYAPSDLRFADLVAGRVAVVLDNAGLSRQAAEAERRMVAALDTLGEAVTMNAPDGRTVYANRAAVALLRADSREDLTTRAVGEISARFAMYDEHGAELQIRDFPAFKALAGDDAPEPLLVRNVVRATGEERWMNNKVTVLRDARGAVDRVVNVIEDVTEVKRAQLAQALLAEATRILSSSLDYADTLQRVAEVAVEALADWCVVDLPGAGGSITPVAVAHADPAKVVLARRLRDRYPVRREAGDGPARVIAEGVTVEAADITDADLVAAATDAEHLGMLRELGLGVLLVVPLTAGGEPLGALTLVRSDPLRRFSDAERWLATELGRRAGSAVLNARLFTERATIAAELQHGLRPPSLPAVPGLELAALYKPAGALNEVGGDFYDAFPTPEGWMIVVGDVAGQGARAAALTGLARFTLRTAGQLTGDPVRAAEQLNRTLRAEPELSLCTAVCIVLAPDDESGLTATIVSLGHPLPVLLRGGTATELGSPGPLAGAFDDAEWPLTMARLEAADALVLYTDGVFDTVGREGRLGEERLLELLAAGPSGAADVVAAVDRALLAFQVGPQSDDTALVAVTVRDPGRVPAAAPPRAAVQGR